MSTTIKEEPKLPTAWDVKTEKYELPDLGNLSSGLKRKQHDTVPLTNDYKLLRALSTDESSEKCYKCIICHDDFKTEQEQEKHRTGTTVYQCIACARDFKYKKQFLVHECEFIDYEEPVIKPRNSTGNDFNNNPDYSVDYACKFCILNKQNLDSVTQFKDYASYLKHVDTLHKANVECHLCLNSFKTNKFDDYLKHMETDHLTSLPDKDCKEKNIKIEEDFICECGLCKFTTEKDSSIESLNTHLLTHVATGTTKLTLNTRKIYCSDCKVLFNYQHDFNLHLFNHVLEKHQASGGRLYCPICHHGNSNQEFESLPEFNSHFNTHVNFNCGICSEKDIGSEKMQNGHLIESHYKNHHLGETVLKQIPNLEKKTVSKCLIEIENVFCVDCNRFFKSSNQLHMHLADEMHLERKSSELKDFSLIAEENIKKENDVILLI